MDLVVDVNSEEAREGLALADARAEHATRVPWWIVAIIFAGLLGVVGVVVSLPHFSFEELFAREKAKVLIGIGGTAVPAVIWLIQRIRRRLERSREVARQTLTYHLRLDDQGVQFTFGDSTWRYPWTDVGALVPYPGLYLLYAGEYTLIIPRRGMPDLLQAQLEDEFRRRKSKDSAKLPA